MSVLISSSVTVEHWGVIPFREAWIRQKELVRRVESGATGNTLVLCQHPTVITIGRTGTHDNIHIAESWLERQGIDVVEIDRGGDVTIHNPGQLVGYPVFNLNTLRTDLHWFLRSIEQAIINVVDTFGIKGDRVGGLTGVWVEQQRKICAIGIHCRRWITYHGFALNVCNDLSEFNLIIPCGIPDRQVTSVSAELGHHVPVSHIITITESAFQECFSRV